VTDVSDLPLVATGRDADVFALDARRVLRRYRDGGDVAAEAAVMSYVAERGFPVPAVYRAHGRDLVMERLAGPTMLRALETGELTVPEAAERLVALHHRLHELPARSASDPAVRILHLDLHPDNVMLTGRGPVLIDWRNAAEGPPALDLAMTAVIAAQVAADPGQPLAGPAARLLTEFLGRLDGVPAWAVDQAVALRRTDPNLTPREAADLARAAELITQYG
jgi:aminoglycoside phosphotransferase (APT) family kinase protein